ncbi:MAG: cyclic nucleotide-binding domain-containing protein [Candidatus Competibacteraceae bacterium]
MGQNDKLDSELNSELDRLLKEHHFFAGMDPTIVEKLSECAALERFKAGQTIFREGSLATRFYLIRHGGVVLEIHVPGRDPIVVDTLGEGDVLGLSWLVAPYHWAYDARAEQATEAISLEVACLRGKYDNDPALAYELFKRYIPVMADRLAATRRRIIDKARASRLTEVK